MLQTELTVSFNAPVDRLYHAWWDPELLQQWFCPAGMAVGQVMSSFQVGGKFRIKVQQDNGSAYFIMGEYSEIVENQRLAFSWQWVDEPNVTQVTLDFSQQGENGSQLTLCHTGFEDQEDRDLHQQAWIECLEKLSTITL
ncbi:SRPBCC domain-containing protein [Alteromonadaceae bacterium M269]|nr:SRPBCC domain-containing protein [Alteromonadaceae bacterium M269]